MARLTKPDLLQVVEDAIRESGWSILYLSPTGTHPARYQVYQGIQNYQIRVYIWNLTHGGGKFRPSDEWRIQVTGINRFEPELGGKTIILGWRDDIGIFTGFDFARHHGALGASPSIQLREHALHQAVIHGFAPHNKGNGELAIAFRPDFFTSYVENLESLHECGAANGEVELLHRLGTDPDDVDDSDIEETIAESRKYAVISTKRALRENDFRDRVLTAYGQRCAMCGIQLRLLDGAHILPAKCPDSTDGTENGVSLCSLHHRAYDSAFVTFDPDFRIHLNHGMTEKLKEIHQAGGLSAFREALRPILVLPPDRRDRPARRFVEAANKLRGWML